MSIRTSLRVLTVLSLGACAPLATAADELIVIPTTKPVVLIPATQPATKPAVAASSAKISPEAKAVVDDMSAAYSKLKSLELSGTLAGHFDVGGQKDDLKEDFTTAFQAPNKFKNDMKASVLLVSTGTKLFAYDKGEKKFSSKEAPKEKVDTKALPGSAARILTLFSGKSNVSVNPSLMLALAKDPSTELTSLAKEISKGADVSIDNKTCTALEVTLIASPAKVTLLVDPDTHLLKRVTTDLKEVVEKSGAPDVKLAQIAINYDVVTPDANLAGDPFNWAPPEGAKEAVAAGAQNVSFETPAEDADPAVALTGKPAPDFTLNGLDGKPVALADLKGKVVVVDFWATWCPPCRKSLPHLNALSEDKDLQAAGLKVLALDLNEEKEKVQGFINDKKFTFTVLLDSEGKVAKEFLVSGIPQTVIIGRDGKIKKVTIGFDEGGEDHLKKAVTDALAEKK